LDTNDSDPVMILAFFTRRSNDGGSLGPDS